MIGRCGTRLKGAATLVRAVDAHGPQPALLMAAKSWPGSSDRIIRTFVTHMVENRKTISQVAHLLFVAKNLERIGDHATNVAEMVYFAAAGTQMVERERGGREV